MRKIHLPGRKPLWEQVHQILEKMIIYREIDPGTRLHEENLSEQFGVSRGPIREAILALQKDGWVDIKHHQGTFVRTPGKEEAKQLLEVRQFLETKVVDLAARRISDEKIHKIQDIVDRGFEALESNDIYASIELNSQFHRKITEATNNIVLARLMEHVEKQVVWYLSAIMSFRGKESWPEHQKILDALKERDPETAVKLMSNHTSATYQAYINSMKDESEKKDRGI